MHRGSSQAAVEAAQLKQLCDAAALRLALSVLNDVGGPDSGETLMQLACVAELCFLSLVFRHSRKPLLIAISERILVAVQWQLHLRARPIASAEVQAGLDLCSRFLSETRDAAESVRVEAYLERALSKDEPLLLPGMPHPPPRLDVLDTRCQSCVHVDQDCCELSPKSNASAGVEYTFLQALLEPSSLPSFERHELVDELRRGLEKLDLLRSDKGIVLSLSGGVDSMVTCCLLWLLQRVLPSEQRFRWCALHLCHPNRDDAKDEEGWVQATCSKLGVELFTYRMEIRRPHGDVRTGISRERYEEKSKELRFQMYARCFEHLGIGLKAGAALVAHHQDDADENRLAELGKSNIVHIDGMSARGTTLGVEVVRPLLPVRKAQLIEFAEKADICYMQDSTPKWSRRGWTRKLLDEIGLKDATKLAQLQAAMIRAGAASEALGEALDSSLSSWKVEGVIPAKVHVPAAPLPRAPPNGPAPAPVLYGEACSVPVVILRLPALLVLAADFEDRLRSLVSDFKSIAVSWNEAIADHQADDADGSDLPIAVAEGDEAGCDENLDDGNGASGACPLQRITVCDSPPDAGPFLLGRAICAALNECDEVNRLLKGQLVARKALKHIWDCVARARREYQWGTMHKQCPCLYVREANVIILCDAEGRSAEFADVKWQFRFAAAAIDLVRQQ
eukprot:TRINITY_DN27008_c0_g1_i1.p1 TRINITY_DN27008_c0_g1~~TRINITY_DN27008_c0_g1_i1.p1  ORF type:complete len:792 (-),score=163.91 TRINITY_DN27008_c0_g1_i1:49-2082(-)